MIIFFSSRSFTSNSRGRWKELPYAKLRNTQFTPQGFNDPVAGRYWTIILWHRNRMQNTHQTFPTGKPRRDVVRLEIYTSPSIYFIQSMKEFAQQAFFWQEITEPQISAPTYAQIMYYIWYRMGHENVARLPFCTCPCDILSGVSMYFAVTAIKITILRREYLNMIRCAQLCIDAGGNHFHHLWWFILTAFDYCINFCIYAMLQSRTTFSLPTLYN